MKPEELKPIVEAWGGPDKMAEILHVKVRTIYYWMAGTHQMSKPTALLIRTLKPKKTTAKE